MSSTRMVALLLKSRLPVATNEINTDQSTSSILKQSVTKKSKYETGSDLLAAMISAVIETVVFYPIDTARVRLQYHVGSLRYPTCSFLNIVSATGSHASFSEKFKNMYCGVGCGIGYNMVKRTIKMGLQPTMKNKIENNFGNDFYKVFANNADIAMHVAAAVPLAWLELFVLFFDVLKVKRQANVEAYRGKSIIEMMRSEDLFRRAFWVSATRITLGTTVFFGAPIMVKQHIFNIEAGARMTAGQSLAASAAGAGLAILMVNPLDVVKTRMMGRLQLKSEANISGTHTAIGIVRNEGIRAFSKGLTAALLCNWPRSTFAMFATTKLRELFYDLGKIKEERVTAKGHARTPH